MQIALGTDTAMPYVFPGYSAHVEMELMRRAGLSEAEVLRAATIKGAELLGVENSMGVLKRGGVANLLLLSENPLTDISNMRSIERVVLKGHVLDVSQDGNIALNDEGP